MPLINADVCTMTILSYRLVWISGRFGGGKTSIAYKLAETYLNKGYRLISNNMSVWSDPIEEVKLLDTGHLKAVVILDEGGLWFKSSKQIEMVASYAAKMDVIYLLPSFWPPTRAAQVLTIQPLFNFKSAGVPIIFYRWRVKLGSFDEKGYFIWFQPSEIYGIYSRQDPGDSGALIVDWLIEKTNEFRAHFGRIDNNISEVEVTESDKFQDAVSALAEAADSWSAVSLRKSGRRRF